MVRLAAAEGSCTERCTEPTPILTRSERHSKSHTTYGSCSGLGMATAFGFMACLTGTLSPKFTLQDVAIVQALNPSGR